MVRNLLETLIFEKENKISGGIYNKMQVDFAYNSNHIEGSKLSHDQTRYIFETKTIDGTAQIEDIFETANHFRCFDLVIDNIGKPLTQEFIKLMHKTLKSNALPKNDEVVIGEYKKYPNEVGGITTSKPSEIESDLSNLLNALPKKLDMYDIASFHANFEKIHPFYDGNGRIGRLIILKMCLENNIVPFFIGDDMKHFYYIALKEWQVESKNMRLVDVFLAAQDDMKTVLDFFEIDYDKSILSAREIIEKHN